MCHAEDCKKRCYFSNSSFVEGVDLNHLGEAYLCRISWVFLFIFATPILSLSSPGDSHLPCVPESHLFPSGSTTAHRVWRSSGNGRWGPYSSRTEHWAGQWAWIMFVHDGGLLGALGTQSFCPPGVWKTYTSPALFWENMTAADIIPAKTICQEVLSSLRNKTAKESDPILLQAICFMWQNHLLPIIHKIDLLLLENEKWIYII